MLRSVAHVSQHMIGTWGLWYRFYSTCGIYRTGHFVCMQNHRQIYVTTMLRLRRPPTPLPFRTRLSRQRTLLTLSCCSGPTEVTGT